ncbi:MAG: sigma-70 family RNA polymerase sigma factor [Planctomycetes bacterium]|nr:sigma-70 family RNA polymerase sigma factor [Planctomycetota bacterium]
MSPPFQAPLAPAVPHLPAATPHFARAHAAARKVLGCDHLADDAVQEALLAWWRLPAPPPDPRGWFVRTAVHRARHLRRTLSRRRRHEDAAARCEHHPACDNPLHHACAHELAKRVGAAVLRLPSEQRAVFELHERTGLDYAGLAHRLAVPEGTVRSRLHRARTAVENALGDDAGVSARARRTSSSPRSSRTRTP